MSKVIEKCQQAIARDSKVYSAGGRLPYYPLVIESAQGVHVTDVDGNKYIDMIASAAAVNTGHAHPRVVQAITEQASKFIHYTPAYMYHQALVDLAEQLIAITPGVFEKRVILGLTGSDAIDGLIKLARAYTGRTAIISFVGAYHGATYGALSLSAISLTMRRKIGPILPETYHISYPNCYRCKYDKAVENCNLECLKELQELFNNYLPADNVAAIVMEPIAGDCGFVVPPHKYMQALHKICKDKGILFAVDEVQQGFGRTGKWFSIEHFAIEPDIIVMGKSIASGMPLSATVARKEITDALAAPAHLFTTMGNPVCCQASLATIDVIREQNLIENAKKLGLYMKNAFIEMQKKYEIIGDVRGLGMTVGVELVMNRESKQKNKPAAAKICYRCWEKGVIITFMAGNILRIQPPLIITKQELDQALEVIEQAIDDFVKGELPDSILEVAQGWSC